MGKKVECPPKAKYVPIEKEEDRSRSFNTNFYHICVHLIMYAYTTDKIVKHF
jgi:hypothetical protein